MRGPASAAFATEVDRIAGSRGGEGAYAAKLNGGSSPPTATSPSAAAGSNPSEDAVALAFVAQHGHDYRFVATWHRWLRWDGKRWCADSTGQVYSRIRDLVRSIVEGGKAERATANAAFISGVERLLRTDQRIAVLPEQLDADAWALNTQDGIVDLRTGTVARHDPARLCTRITRTGIDPRQGAALWQQFLADITQGDAELAAYLQRVAGYCATGATSEDVLIFLFGPGANGKSSFVEAVEHALGDYAKVFSAEVLMESKGERHPTDLAQFIGVRFAVTSEPASNAAWNDARIKSLTGDARISARFMRGDFFEFERTHKTVVLGNHMPRLSEVTHAIRRRVQMVPFRAVFSPTPGTGMRERLKDEAGGAILAWVVEGALAWQRQGTAPPQAVKATTEDYLSDQDVFGQWFKARCERAGNAFELSSALHRDYVSWCEQQGLPPKSNVALSAHLVSAGFVKRPTMVGKVFDGLRKKAP